MPYSDPETKPFIVDRIKACNARRVLDVGAGFGVWAYALRQAKFRGRVDAVEVWAPYVAQFKLRTLYRRIHVGDVRTMPATLWAGYDVVIFGDVLEHMTKDEAVSLWNAAKVCKHAAIAIPIVEMHQDAVGGNPYEVHVKHDWTHEEVLATFDGITESQAFVLTGAYWR
jgi:predicted TPR repeat methyltransferase